MRKFVCQICKEEINLKGTGSHFRYKHAGIDRLEGYGSNEYAKEFGEFRPKELKIQERKKQGNFECKECDFIAVSNKALAQHIRKVHADIGWQNYYVRHYFNGKWPECACGCGEKVTLLLHGNPAYARKYSDSRHVAGTREPGYRTNTFEQRQKMRKSAIERLRKNNSTFHQSGPSKSEIELNKFLTDELLLKTETSNKELLNGKEIDIIIPDKNLAIEYNGIYFHSDSYKKDKRYHLKKTLDCKEVGLDLIHIWSCDWRKKKEIIKSILRNKTNKVDNKIYARKTQVKVISNEEANAFLKQNHLQGSSISKIRLGLYYKEELVSVMTFSSLRRATGRKAKKGSYELIRYCTKLNTVVIGGATKLFKFFTKHYNPEYILSYANRDWSTGNVYSKLGMTFIGETKPGYFYVKSQIRYSRVQFQKHKLVEQGADKNKTEYQIMSENGYYRVWDCGNLVYEWKKEE